MDVPATRPVTGASTAPATTQATGRHPLLSTELPPEPKAQPARVQATAPAEDMQHTRRAIAEQVSRFLQSSTRNLEFQVDNDSGQAIIVVRDAEGQVIRRIPGEEVLQIAHRLNAHSGTLIDSLA